MRSIPVSSAPLISIARACGRSVPRGGHRGYAIEPPYPKGETGGALKLPTEVRQRHGTYKVSLIYR